MPTEKQIVINPRELVKCAGCGMVLPILQLVSGERVVVQPFPVQPIVPARPKVIMTGPTPPAVALKKLMEQTWEGTTGAPVYIPHAHVCPRGADGRPTLLLALEPPEEIMRELEDGEHQRPEGSTGDGREAGPEISPEDELAAALDERGALDPAK